MQRRALPIVSKCEGFVKKILQVDSLLKTSILLLLSSRTQITIGYAWKYQLNKKIDYHYRYIGNLFAEYNITKGPLV